VCDVPGWCLGWVLELGVPTVPAHSSHSSCLHYLPLRLPPPKPTPLKRYLDNQYHNSN